MKRFEFNEIDGVQIIKPHGEMTFFFLEELDEFLKEKIKSNSYKFVFDFNDVNWIDSMGLGLLAMTIKNSLLNDTKVVILNPKDNVIELFRLSSLYDLIFIAKSLESAIDYLKK